MHFETEHIFHIYNQGNNREKIFYKIENYLFFLKKLEMHVLPYADVLAYCLMPNHFHLMVYVNEVIIGETVGETAQKPYDKDGETVGVTARKPNAGVSHPDSKRRDFNSAIGIMLRSYTRAVNNQENRSGGLFREETKAECLTKSSGISPSFFNTNQGALINVPNPAKEYSQVCFNYIHNNPVKAGLVKKPEDWEFSSYNSYYKNQNEKLLIFTGQKKTD
ncbi:MAG: hypothetical protein WC401_09325 [Bacteroidales bacterium]|jgi:putative transposase|nr:hypothetical protein [Bacteroidales bacterium]